MWPPEHVPKRREIVRRTFASVLVAASNGVMT
jgi:hypothetical protein